MLTLKQKNKYETAFNEAFKRLNNAQREAVDAIEGPVLVIAGPGTGKTQILATRIGKILQNTDTQPHNILCLTYTDTGKAEMRNRLFTLIGPAAHRVNIHTFHSFCNEVIQDNLSRFGKQNLEPITELEEAELFHRLLDSLPIESPLKRFKGDIAFEATRVKKLFALMKKENWSIEELNLKIDSWLSELPLKTEFIYRKKYKGFNAGDPNPSKIKEETDNMEKLRAAINLYPVYNEMMREIGRYTFDDMILWVLKEFKENINLLLSYQERFLYFLVDEFQDTSGSQNNLLKYLIEYWEAPNVFVVGDDDQSIYSFQGANVENIRQFENQYEKNIKKIVLTENYRSTQVILDVAKQLIEYNKERLVADKKLVAVSPSSTLQIPRLIEFPNLYHESIYIANEIEELITQGVSPDEIAVIYRNHKQVDDLATWLEKKKIAVNMKRNVNILELPFVTKILKILEFIATENDVAYSGDELLFEILHFDFFNIPPLDIARLSIEVSQKNYGNRREKHSLRMAIYRDSTHGAPDLFSHPRTGELKKVSRALEYLVAKMNNVTLQELFEEVVREAGILNYVINSIDKQWYMEVLTALFGFIKSETRKDPDITLPRLLAMIETMQKLSIRIEMQKISAAENGVNLVTAHGSKGTEYEHVYIIGCNKNIWDAHNSSRLGTFKLPGNFSAGYNTPKDANNTDEMDELEESRRLFYVALTRAKTHLTISYPVKDEKDKNLERSAFVGETLEGNNISEIKKHQDDKMIFEFLGLQFTPKPIPQIKLIDKQYINKRLEGYTLSVTHLNNYLDCPIKFYYQNLIQVPAAKSESMAFGSVIHSTLQALFEKMKENNNTFPGKQIMMNDYDMYMHRHRESFTKEQFKRRLEYGQKILPAYYDFYIDKWNKIVNLEYNIRNVEVKGVPLNGKLDKLEFNGKKVNVVDYKTGRYDNARKKLLPPGDDNPIGGDYWRQAVFYKILLDNQRRNDWLAESSEFDFIEPVKAIYKKEKIDIAKQDIEIVTEQIAATWQKIQNHEFDKGCGKEDCPWCNFVKDNKLDVALHEAMDEE